MGDNAQVALAVEEAPAGPPRHAYEATATATALLEARESSTSLAAIVETTSDMVGIVDQQGRVTYLNKAAREAFGHLEPDLADLPAANLYTPESAADYIHEIVPVLLAGETWSGEAGMYRSDRTVMQVWQTVSAEIGADGQLFRVFAVGRDITDLKRTEATLAHRATHDPLTGLPNRTLLLEEMETAVATSARTGQPLALLFLDLDRFKVINDRLGHEIGDEVLVQVANRLASIVRPTDLVARMGGDEFVVLCTDIGGEEHALEIAERVRAGIEAEPFVVHGVELVLTASLGVSVCAKGDNHAEGLLREADAAMYRAKDQGRARLELYDDAMRLRVLRRAQLSEELGRGLERDEICVFYQPTIDLYTGCVTGMEALARWHHPRRGLLTPGMFIELAEDTGLITTLGRAVLHQACRQAAAWQALLGDRCPLVHVNLSPRQLVTGDLVRTVSSELEESGLDPRLLCLEITENALVDDAETAIAILRHLKDLGVVLAIDDFGTGYSSLSYLRRFPVDVLKVDRSFVDGLGPDPEDSAIVAAVVKLAHTLDLQAIAEGVETHEQLRKLRSLGCDAAQGFLFSRPQPSPLAEALLEHRFEL